MLTLHRGRPLLIYGAVLSLLAFGVFLVPGIGPALLNTAGYAPHGVCILWQPGLLWFHVTNDLLIGSSYVAIASTLAFLVYKGRRDLPFHWVLLAFGAFIISCGSTHFVEAWTFWQPYYWLAGYLKLITAVASVATAVALPALLPRILGLLDEARVSSERKARLEAANAELAQLNARLTELDDLKSQLFANVSHELRTPLTLILGPVELLLLDAPESQRRDLETIRRNALLLQRHVEDLLDVARLEAGRFELRRSPVDLGQLAALTADYFGAAAQQRQMHLQVDAPEGLFAEVDSEQIQRVLLNLVGNAMKFTPDGGTVRLSLQPAGDQLVLAVEDSGPGVPVAQRETIFERFHQGEGGTTRRFGGTGLGLAIARELVALHGGTITVDASELGGARFAVTLAAAPTAPPSPARIAPPDQTLPQPAPRAETPAPGVVTASGGEQPLILVVEDNGEVRQFVAGLLADGYRVITANNGLEGEAKALALRPDLIISDVMMPDMSGDQLVRALRRRPELEQTPIMMLTARADPELRLELLRGGAQEYLLKPFSAAELRARLGNLLVMARARRTLQAALADSEANLATLSGELARQYGAAQAAVRLRDEFIAIAAHELRTPVTALLGNTQLLARRAEREGTLGERDLRAVLSIGQLGERLAAMIERLLDTAQLERGELTMAMENLELGGLVASTCELLRPTLGRHRLVVLTAERPLVVRGDGARLGQVLTNLLTNAARFSPPDTSITVRVSADPESARITVADQGSGIPPAALPHIFERFYRASSTGLVHTGGLGLGLYLAHEIVRRHQGALSVSSVEGQGSTFSITLPLVQP